MAHELYIIDALVPRLASVLRPPISQTRLTHSTSSSKSAGTISSVPILGLDVIRHRLGLLIVMVRVVWVVWWADILHLVGASAFVAALERALPGNLHIHGPILVFG
jgi:hypothetical protein